ncbi:DNA mismatch repair protein MutS [uncultured Dokdonia sp.]|uniref:MutS-related protein n=1 Tax=uncultured Dokdonia sp. TaxID=575653 RepID=UPI00261ECCA8|nr:DNA mismatch repair protein MutS [uncultured Dokdonia sp.]
MNNPSQFYKDQKITHQEALSKIKGQLNVSSTIRLLLFLGILGSIYVTFGNWRLMAGVLLVKVTLFVFLVVRHGKFIYQRDLIKALIAINETELKVLDRDFHDLPTGEEYHDPNHFYSQDIDLFGRGSFFQYLNRTALESGADVLAGIVKANEITDIPAKQKAIQELSTLPEWRQQFSAIASLVKTEVPATTVTTWLQAYTPFVPKNAKIGSRIFSGISLAGLVLYFLGFIHGSFVIGWFLLGLAIIGKFVKKINVLAAYTGKIQSTFDQYHKLLAKIEEQTFESDVLKEKSARIINTSQKASGVLRSFSRHLDAFDQRNNILIGIIANGFFIRDLLVVSQIETWIAKHKNDVAIWFEIITFFDAYNSLGNYDFNHPHHHYPEITDSNVTLEATQTAHPLLDSAKAIRNDVTIDTEQFFIITGANMAGKSTFLRTVALQIVMGNIGLPVCAQKTSYTPIKLITSMRTTDSLTDDESYFFSELKRLKFIVEEIKNDRYFIILDEILKGTNSTDKAIGSRKFVDKLVGSKSTGIIATHDLSLCEAAQDLPQVKNYYFDARIEDDELYFDYTFKEGICQNMNASFLLKKMEIVD